jgi:SAM-dependent methyltransferase
MQTSSPESPSDRIRRQWEERVVRYARDSAPKLRQFALALVDLVPPPASGKVLDVATGTGTVAIEAGHRVGAAGTVVATDFLVAWEPLVREAATEASLTNLDFVSMPAEALAFPDETFDVVYCQFGLMFFSDQKRALREMRRVLRPSGRIGISVWSVPERVAFFLVPNVVGPSLPPPAEPFPSPMSMGTPGLVAALVAGAGFRDVTVHHVVRHHVVADPEQEWRAWTEDLATPLASGLASLPETEQAQVHDRAVSALEEFRDGEVLKLPSEVIVVTATA